MKILFISRYVDPHPVGGNRNVFLQAKSLQDNFGVNVEILTWPLNDLWTGPMPDQLAQVPALQVVREGLIYHVFTAPLEWDANGSVIKESVWEEAVAYGMRLLQSLKPDIVHLQHRHGLWWLLDSAQRLGIPTVYSNHDWGIACLRTILVMGDNSLCDGRLSVDKCAQCIFQGRGLVGKVNEIVAGSAIGRGLIEAVYRSPLKDVFQRYGAVKLPVRERVDLNLGRVKKIFGNLSAMFTPSHFGRAFFTQLGVPEDCIYVEPWYNDTTQTHKTLTEEQPFIITYIGRISPEKGVHLIFEALNRVTSSEPIHLRIAGMNTSLYCIGLKNKYGSQLGSNKVEWLGWSEVESLFLSTDVSIIPSTSMDNTPLSLIESLSYKVPVIATRIPPIEDLVTDGQNGYLADYNSVESLTAAIERAVVDKKKIRSGAMQFPKINTVREYTHAIKEAYLKIKLPANVA